MLRMFKQASVLLLAVAALLVWLPYSASAVTFTGCLTHNGSIKKMQQGGLPLSPCTDKELQIALNSEGPQGPKGDTGDTGPQGFMGDTGDAGVGGGDLFEFVGYSDNVVIGGVGYDGLAAECADTFGDDARVATTEEYIKSTPVNAPATTPAWIHGVITAAVGTLLIDYSGYSRVEAQWNCQQWSSSEVNDRGIVLLTSGSINSEPCDTNNVVGSAPPL